MGIGKRMVERSSFHDDARRPGTSSFHFFASLKLCTESSEKFSGFMHELDNLFML
jgi:hypothetical protein